MPRRQHRRQSRVKPQRNPRRPPPASRSAERQPRHPPPVRAPPGPRQSEKTPHAASAESPRRPPEPLRLGQIASRAISSSPCPAVPRRLFHHVPVTVARRKIHRRINRPPDRAAESSSVALIRSTNSRQSIAESTRMLADAVADRHLVRRLMLGFELRAFLQRLRLLGEPLLDPGKRNRQAGIFSLQPPRNFRDEPVRQLRVRIAPCPPSTTISFAG